MKVLLPSTGESLEDFVDSKFGRCEYYIIYDTETESFEIFRNSAVVLEHSAGSSLALASINYGVDVVIISRIGRKPFDMLQSANIRIYKSSETSTVRNAITNYLLGKLPILGSKAPSEAVFQPHNLN
jgi:predicted Fe-Mo cluster-binding NifX family protein